MRETVSRHSLLTGAYLLSTAGCASVSHMDAGLNALIGENVSTAIAVLGKPSAKESIGKDTLYAWTARRTEARPERYESDSYRGRMTDMVVLTTTVNMQYEYYCNVRIFVNATGRITNTAHDGNRGGCQDYDKALKKYVEQAQTGQQKNGSVN